MRARLLGTVVGLALLLAVPAGAQDKGGQKYKVTIKNIEGPYERDGKLVYRVAFRISLAGKAAPTSDSRDFVVITENGKEAHRLELGQVKIRDLTTVLAMDISGSMEMRSAKTKNERGENTGPKRIEEARDAAAFFFKQLHAKADAGLILFNHAIQVSRPPARDPARVVANRRQLVKDIRDARPSGGTAYLDATHEALQMLKGVKGNRAVVLMTDGVDVNSQRKANDVIRTAKALGIPIYVLGVGDPGAVDPVSTVLVLDHSKSMEAPAGVAEAGKPAVSKIQALHDAASRFVNLMHRKAMATLLPFSSQVEQPLPFTNNQGSLRTRINQLQPEGGTSLYDATFAGIETVVAARLPGKRYVVVLTDGIDEDPGSRHDPEDVIERAREAKVAVYMLGLGDKKEINEPVMRRIAESTGGKYFHAENQKRLFEIFEALSLDIHGDGIDEEALQHLATSTGGKYFRASDASELKLIYEGLAEEFKTEYEEVFPSLNQKKDGTVSAIDIKIADKEGNVLSDTASADVARPGLVVAEMDYGVYLVLLGVLLGLLYLPAGLKRMTQSSGASGA
jgi:VWFA-related protein